MNTNLRDLKPYIDYQNGLIAASFLVSFSVFAGFYVSNFLKLTKEPAWQHIKFLWAVFNHNAQLSTYSHFLAARPLESFIFWAIPISFFTGAIWFTFSYLLREIDPIIHLRGRRFLVGENALKSAQNASQKLLGAPQFNLELTQNIFLTRAKELQSILIMGCQGGGKTVIINFLLCQIIQKGEKAIIYDLTKGDYTSWVDCPILSPTDSRSCFWDIGRDLTDLADASTFANSVILTNDKDPFWSNTSQNVLIAIIVKLQKERGQNWGFSELSELIFKSEIEELKQICETYYLPANGSLIDAESKMTGSIIVNLRSFCAPIYRLNEAWQNVDSKKGICFSNWLQNDNSKVRQIIIQGDQRDGVLSAGLARAVTNFCTTRIASLQFAESKTRKIWFVLDELPQIGRLESIAKLLEIGRSKGVSCIFGFQDISQVRQIYAKGEEQKWLAMFGLKIFPKVQGSESQKWVCAETGQREVQFRAKSVSSNTQGQSISFNLQKETIDVLLSSQLDSDFGPGKNGIDALVLGLGADALRLNFPFQKITEIRESFVSWPSKPASKKPENETRELQIERQIEPQNQEQIAKKEALEIAQNQATNPIFDLLEPINSAPIIQNANIKNDENEVEAEILGGIGQEIIAETLGINSHILDVAKEVLEVTEPIKSDPQSQNATPQKQTPTPRKLTKKERLASYENDYE